MPTLVELKKIATRLKIQGRSSMNKHELEQAIRNHNLTPGSRKSRVKKTSGKKSRKPRAKKPKVKKSRKPRAKKPKVKKSRKPRAKKPKVKKSRKPRVKKPRAKKSRVKKPKVKKSRKPRAKKSVKKQDDINISNCDNYENTEPLSWESLTEDVPKKYIISFDFNVGGSKVTMCYNIAYLRNYLVSSDTVPLLRGTFDRKVVKLTQAQRDKARKQWNAIVKANKAGFKRYLAEQDPKWAKELTWDKKVYKNPYVKLVSQATPVANFNAIHILTPKKLVELKRKHHHVENTIHMDPKIYNDVKRAAKWTIEFPSGRDVEANRVWYDDTNFKNTIASDQDAGRIMAALIKMFDKDKLVQRKLIDGKNKWVLALPLETEKDFSIAVTPSQIKKILRSGGNIVDNKKWSKLLTKYKAGLKYDVGNPNRKGVEQFYKLWVALASALNTLSYH